ncbi:hypothetical protein [Nocardia pseudobrasiliensis]|uniref:Uncharacterized protein n=1 Tax=Nocardia pseudobrasiliensis TaxID=45979 RepID=A0A370IC68_9NOCA|nr:hypothetical protein [Nocardia pseudobrasiliensis]RDI68332.1 hypothetical protein DFR76_102733 [Nocardia pseudobrasiliensis]
MIDNVPAHRDFDDAPSRIVWPDPSPLNSWWDAVMHGEVLTVPRAPGRLH